MSGNAMSLKAKIRNIASKNDMSAQVVLQNYMFERFLERLSKSDYKDNFILKGGMLIASIIGIGQRSTMDMDITLKNYPISIQTLTNIISEILSIELDDDVTFSFVGIEPIRDDDIYGGFRISIKSVYFEVVTPLQIDITTGDVITPKEVMYFYSLLFSDDSIGVWAYNIETVLAEKVESVLKRGELNTRPRDFYDVYILLKTQVIDNSIFRTALERTAEHRNTTYILDALNKRIESLRVSETLKVRWNKYAKNYRYAAEIPYEGVIEALIHLLQIEPQAGEPN